MAGGEVERPETQDAVLRARLNALHEILARADPDHSVMQQLLLREAVSSMKMDFGSVGFARDGVAVPVSAITITDAVPLTEPTPLDLTLAGTMLAESRTLAIGDLAHDPRFASHVQVSTLDVRAFIGTHVTVNGTTYFFSMGSESPRTAEFTADDIAYVELLAAVFAGSLRRKVLDERLSDLERRDRFTGLPLQTVLIDHLRDAIAGSPGSDSISAVLGIDIDIGRILERYDYEISGKLVRDVALRLTAFPDFKSTAYRGRDCDFFLLATQLAGTGEVEKFVAQVQRALAVPFVYGANEIMVSQSIGVALADRSTLRSAEEVANEATGSVKIAKAETRRRVVQTPAELMNAVERRRSMIVDMKNGIENGELRLEYQPYIDVMTRRPLGAEALVRWVSPSRGTLQPDEFIPQIEDTDVITAMGGWVMREAARCARRLATLGHRLSVAFNVAGQQLHDPTFLDRLNAAIADAGADPHTLEIEITESAALAEPEAVRATLHQCRELGVKVALDDFGTGYSSLAYLRALPVDVVKIDASFVRALPGDEACATISGAVIALSHRLHRIVQAEGVETQEQLDWLRAEGCDFAQGFYISRPLSEHALVDWLRENWKVN